MQRKVYILEGLDCANCAAKVENKLSKMPGLHDVSVTFATKQLRFTAEDPDAILPEVKALIKKLEPEVEVLERTRGSKRTTPSTTEIEHHHHHHHHDEEESCSCGHDHHHHHDEDDDEEEGSCSCGHDHHHHHHHHDDDEEESCNCGHDHHDHHHHDEEESCSCGHDHHHHHHDDEEESCSCGHDHHDHHHHHHHHDDDDEEESCSCGHDHHDHHHHHDDDDDDEEESCSCGHDHHDHHDHHHHDEEESCNCGHDHHHHHDDDDDEEESCSCGHDHHHHHHHDDDDEEESCSCGHDHHDHHDHHHHHHHHDHDHEHKEGPHPTRSHTHFKEEVHHVEGHPENCECEECHSYVEYCDVCGESLANCKCKMPDEDMEKRVYILEGLDCANCAMKIEGKLRQMPEIEFCTVSYATKQLRVSANNQDELLPKMQAVIDAIEDGVTVVPRQRKKISSVSNTKIYILEGLDCANCAAKIEKKLQKLEGVDDLSITFATKQMKVSAKDPDGLVPALQAAIDAIEDGVTVVPKEMPKASTPADAKKEDEDPVWKHPLFSVGVGAVLFIIGELIINVGHVSENSITMLPIFLIAYFILGGNVLKTAVSNIKKGQVFDENFLMCVATIGAFLIQEFPEAVGVMLFYRIGEYFEDRATEQSRSQIMEAVDLRPEVVNLVVGDDVRVIDAEEAVVGDIVLVRPGDRIPLDGVIIDGESQIDTSPVTGEPVPVTVRVGDNIVSGCVNNTGALKMRVEKILEESMVTRILDSVENAAASKPGIDKFITRFARVYTPFVVFFALAVAILLPLLPFGGFTWGMAHGTSHSSVYTALTFLVISCPCALVLSVPLAFFSGIGAASKKGILFKGGIAIEALCKVQAVVMDKTGTITKGNFVVQSANPVAQATETSVSQTAETSDSQAAETSAVQATKTSDSQIAETSVSQAAETSVSQVTKPSVTQIPMTSKKLLSISASCELNSTHPIGSSIVEAARAENLEIERPSKVEEIAGHGIRAEISQGVVLCGNRKLMDENDIDLSAYHKTEFGTEVLVALNGKFVGNIVISDTIKDDAKSAIAEVKKLGITTVMLTGDAQDSADAVAKETGIDEVHAKLLPQDKVSELQSVRNAHGAVMFVGDGINDAPVLAGADVGAAMGSGADAAIEAADVVFMNSEMKAIPEAIDIARQTNRISWQNVYFALVVKIIVMLAGLFGFANMWLAVFADTGVSVLCLLNSIRILNRK